MARPFKKGLGYFPLDTDFMSNRKIQRLMQRYGCNGIGVYVCILCEIYGENGYFIPFDTDFCFDISFTLGLEEKLIREIVSFCVQIHLFDSELMEYNQILSSEGIQARYKEISKRSSHTIDPTIDLSRKEYLPAAPAPKNEVNATKTDVSVTEIGVNVAETPVFAAKTPTNGNGNTNRNFNTNTQNSNFYDNENSTDKEEAGRRAELFRMAADAARGDRNA